ncbi:porin [Ideonella sp. BN130291]|uniref:porin n=1 Tax=Ideonella sp. BN130291 TaxID=3112940 RepID=UPI002E26A5FF|nr:porin [Ideonella sp. BN130291]
MKNPSCGPMLAAAALALSLAPAIAQNNVAVYGQIRLTANSIKTGSASDLKELRDNASRLGFRGTEDLGGGMSALFGLEMGVSADDGTVPAPAYRHSFVGLRGAYGTVALGRLDSANPTGSPLYSQVTAITSFAPNDAGATAIGTSVLNARNRTSNSIGYQSPNVGGFDVRVRGYLRGAPAAPDNENGAKSVDIGLNYATGPLKLAFGVARDERPGGLLGNEFDNKVQFGVRYDFGSVQPYALLGRDRYKNTATTRREVDYWIVGTKCIQGAHTVVLNAMQRAVQSNLIGQRRRQQVSYQYALSKRTELQAFVDRDGVDSSKRDVRVRAIGAGIRHDF